MNKKALYKVDNLHCASCVQKIEDHLAKQDGILKSSVNFASAHAVVDYDPEKTDATSIAKAIADIGYPATPLQAAKQKKDYTLALTIAALAMSSVISLGMFGVNVPLWLQIVLATAVQFGPGLPFYIGTWNGLKHFSANMDTLVCLGTSAAYGYSFYSEHLYFETSALLISFILLGRFLESQAKRRANAGMTSLLKLQPKSARVLQEGGDYADVPIEQVQRGTLFLVRPGERIPFDAIVTQGESHVDEGMLTGESRPVKKGEGAQVYAGTVNQGGSLQAKAINVGEETALGHIIRMVEEAQTSKAPIERVADRITAVFVPVVLGIAGLTFFIWWLLMGDPSEGLKNGIAVLVIACPCALGLATPTVILVATGKAAQKNILIKNAEVLEIAQNIDTLFLDKTGTVTEGKLRVLNVVVREGADRKAALATAAQLAALSEHPISHAIAEHLKRETLPKASIEQFISHSGKGVQGSREKKVYYLGSAPFLKSMNVDLTPFETNLSQETETVAVLGDATTVLAYFVLSDPLKKEAKSAIEEFHQLGMKVYLLTGDRTSVAERIAKELNVDGFKAELLPEDKMRYIREMKNNRVYRKSLKNRFFGEKGPQDLDSERMTIAEWQGKSENPNPKAILTWPKTDSSCCFGIIAMVGDGINDAPALAEARVSFAIGAGTAVAIESASVILMKSQLSGVGDTVRLARKTFQKIRQNLFFAFGYNCLGIPIAAIGLLNPIIAGAAMALSSISVLCNALLLEDT